MHFAEQCIYKVFSESKELSMLAYRQYDRFNVVNRLCTLINVYTITFRFLVANVISNNSLKAQMYSIHCPRRVMVYDLICKCDTFCQCRKFVRLCNCERGTTRRQTYQAMTNQACISFRKVLFSSARYPWVNCAFGKKMNWLGRLVVQGLVKLDSNTFAANLLFIIRYYYVVVR